MTLDEEDQKHSLRRAADKARDKAQQCLREGVLEPAAAAAAGTTAQPRGKVAFDEACALILWRATATAATSLWWHWRRVQRECWAAQVAHLYRMNNSIVSYV